MTKLADYAEYLTEEAHSDIAAVHEFRLLLGRDGGAFHVFFEGGEDFQFYMPALRRRAGGRDIHPYNCGGKQNVISAKKDIVNGGYGLEVCMFFVDRDYDDYTGNQPLASNDLYITDYYSIESHMPTSQSTQIILVDLIGLPPTSAEYNTIASIIESAMSNFSLKMQIVSAWCMEAKIGDEKPNFNNANFTKLMRFNADGSVSTVPRYLRKFVSNVSCKPTNITASQMVNRIRSFKALDRKIWLRGKYELWAYEHILIAALQSFSATCKAGGKKVPRIPSSIRDRNLFDALGGRMSVPPSLDQFLSRKMGNVGGGIGDAAA